MQNGTSTSPQKKQKEAFGRAKSEKRKRVSSTTESDASEIIIQRKKMQKKKKKATPEMIVDPYAEDESIPKKINIATSSTEAETAKQAGPEQKHKEEAEEGMMQNPQESAIPLVATTKWETANKGPIPPTRVIERVRVPTKRYGIDLVQKTYKKKTELKLLKLLNCTQHCISVVILVTKLLSYLC